jgi:hypothetical protein
MRRQAVAAFSVAAEADEAACCRPLGGGLSNPTLPR